MSASDNNSFYKYLMVYNGDVWCAVVHAWYVMVWYRNDSAYLLQCCTSYNVKIPIFQLVNEFSQDHVTY